MANSIDKSFSKEIFDAILESSMAGYWDWWPQEDYEFYSTRFKSMLGYSDDEVPNKPSWWQQQIFQEDLPSVIDCYNEHVKTKGECPYDSTVRYHHKDGSTVWVHCRGKIVTWQGDSPVRMVGCHIDITDLKRVQQQRESKLLKELKKLLDQNIAALSELRHE